MARGGPRPNSGRKSKAEELGLQAMLDKAWPESSRLKFFSELAKMAENPRTAQGLEAGKLLSAYTYGKPKERVELSGNQNEPIVIKPVNYRAAIAAIATGSEPDSTSSGED